MKRSYLPPHTETIALHLEGQLLEGSITGGTNSLTLLENITFETRGGGWNCTNWAQEDEDEQ